MKITLLTTLSVCLSFLSFAQNVNIPDVNFKALLLSDTTVNTNLDNEIQLTEAQNFSGALHLNSGGILDLTGIEEFTSCTYLNITSNSLPSLIFTDTMALTNINANYNEIDSIGLRFCPNLNGLNLRGNNIDNIDLSNNALVSYLNLLDNDLTEIDLSNNLNLGFVDLASNDLASLDVTNNVNIETLYLVANEIPSIDLSTLSLLRRLNVSGNLLTSLDVTHNPLLFDLYGSYNDISTLDLSNNPLLEVVFFSDTDLSQIDLSANNLVADVYLAQNNITSINVSHCPDLERLVMAGNPVSEIDLSAQSALRNIDVNNCPNLQALNIRNGNNANMVAHNFTNCPALTCITVDNVVYANTNFTSKDATTSYNTDCNYCFNSYLVIDTAICAGESYTSPMASVYTATGVYYDSLVNACGSDSIISINLKVSDTDAVQLAAEEFCAGDTTDFYGTAISMSGTYYQTFNNANGCDSLVSKTFTELENVSIVDNQGTLEATGNMDSYQWFQDGNSIPNATNANYTPAVDGDYFCEAIVGSCSSSSNILSIIVDTSTTAIQNLSVESFKIYPNPTKDLLHIDTEDTKVLSLKLYDLAGKLIEAFDAQSKLIDMTSFDNGYFLLRLETDKGVASFKVMKN